MHDRKNRIRLLGTATVFVVGALLAAPAYAGPYDNGDYGNSAGYGSNGSSSYGDSYNSTDNDTYNDRNRRAYNAGDCRRDERDEARGVPPPRYDRYGNPCTPRYTSEDNGPNGDRSRERSYSGRTAGNYGSDEDNTGSYSGSTSGSTQSRGGYDSDRYGSTNNRTSSNYDDSDRDRSASSTGRYDDAGRDTGVSGSSAMNNRTADNYGDKPRSNMREPALRMHQHRAHVRRASLREDDESGGMQTAAPKHQTATSRSRHHRKRLEKAEINKEAPPPHGY